MFIHIVCNFGMDLVISPLTLCIWEHEPSGQNHIC